MTVFAEKSYTEECFSIETARSPACCFNRKTLLCIGFRPQKRSSAIKGLMKRWVMGFSRRNLCTPGWGYKSSRGCLNLEICQICVRPGGEAFLKHGCKHPCFRKCFTSWSYTNLTNFDPLEFSYPQPGVYGFLLEKPNRVQNVTKPLQKYF